MSQARNWRTFDVHRELSLDLVPAVTSVAIPAGVLQAGAKYDPEVVARESSGNQTVTEVPFTTRR